MALVRRAGAYTQPEEKSLRIIKASDLTPREADLMFR